MKREKKPRVFRHPKQPWWVGSNHKGEWYAAKSWAEALRWALCRNEHGYSRGTGHGCP